MTLKRRVAIPRAEADFWVRQAAEGHWSGDVPGLRLLGLFTWTPKPWDAHVGDTGRDYYVWIYQMDWYAPDAALDEFSDPDMWDAPEAFIVSTYPKTGNHCHGDGDVEVHEATLEEALEDTKPTTARHLRKSGLTDVEILGILP